MLPPVERRQRFRGDWLTCVFFARCLFSAMHPSRFDVAASGGVGPCFGEPPLPALPLPGGDDELFSTAGGNGDLSPTCCMAEISPTFEKPYMREMEKTIEGTRFVAQHMKNKDKFESVSIFV